MRARYVILCNEAGGILNDPVLLRVAEDEFWFSLSDSDLWLWLQGVNVGKRFDVQIAEIDVCPGADPGPQVGRPDGRPVRTRAGRAALLRADGRHRGGPPGDHFPDRVHR